MELVLAVDVSRSVSPNELEIQRRGYAEAITSPEVLEAVPRRPLSCTSSGAMTARPRRDRKSVV